MDANAAYLPLGAVIALLGLSWYLLSMPVALDGARHPDLSWQTPTAASALEAR